MIAVLDCAFLWTGNPKEVLRNVSLHIHNGVITDISPAEYPCPNVFVMPSFIDSHCHILWTGLQNVCLNLGSVRSASDLLAFVRSEIEKGVSGDILRGESFDETTWKSSSLPTLQELDFASGERPVFLRRVCGHMGIVNSAMLHKLPTGAEGVDRNTGIIREGIALEFNKLFPPPRGILKQALKSAEKLAFSCGITAVCSMESLDSAVFIGGADIDLEISIGVHSEDADLLYNLSEKSPGVVASVIGIKFFLDGSFGAATAAVSEPYLDGTCGRLLMDDDTLYRGMLKAYSAGYRVMAHAIGGLALEQLDRISGKLIREVKTKTGKRDLKIRVEHAEELLPAWRGNWDTSVHVFSMQPNFTSVWQTPGGMCEQRLGRERSMKLNPYGLVLNNGFDLCFGSDGMPLGPLVGMPGAVLHPTPEFRLDTENALFAYTIGAAEASGFPELAIPVKPGRKADLAVLTSNPFSTETLSELEVFATILNGKVVYGNGGVLKSDTD